MKHYPQTPPESIALDDELLLVASGFKSKAQWTGSGGQAKLMALEPDEFEKDEHGEPIKSDFDYDALYFWTSHYVHATVPAIEAHACVRGEIFKVHGQSWRDEPRGVDALFNTVMFLCKIFVVACRAMNEEQPAILQDMYKMIAGFARSTVV